MVVRKISEIESGRALLEELEQKNTGIYHLTPEVRQLILKTSLERLIMSVRAENDWRSGWQPISTWKGLSGETVSNVVRAMVSLGFVLVEEHFPAILVRAFLARNIVKDPSFGSVQEYETRVPYSRERIGAFHDVLDTTLTEYEKSVLINVMAGMMSLDRIPDEEVTAAQAFEQALCKLQGDFDSLKKLCSGKGMTLEEAAKYRNAYTALERIYWLEKGPWLL